MKLALLTAVMLVLYAVTAWQMLDQTPIGERVEKIDIHLVSGANPVIIGYAELGQHPGAGAAVADHLQISRDRQGWWIANLSSQRRVDAQTKLHPMRYLRRWPVATGDRMRLNGVVVAVQEIGQDNLVLRGPDNTVMRWTGATLQQQSYAKCPQEGTNWLWWRQHFGYLSKVQEFRLFTIGGQVPCARRWPLPGVPANGVQVMLSTDGSYWLAPGTAEVSFAHSGEQRWRSFADLSVQLDDPIDPTTGLILGRTHYRLDKNVVDADTVTLIPDGGTDIWLRSNQERPVPRDTRVQVSWKPAILTVKSWKLFRWLYGNWPWILAALGFGILSGAMVRRRFADLSPAIFMPALIFGTLTLATAWTDPVPTALLLLSLGLAWSGGSLVLFSTNRLRGATGLLWVAAVGLILFGSIVQGQLGLGGNNTSWLNRAEGHWRILAAMGWGILLLTLVPRATWEGIAIMLIAPNTHSANAWWQWSRIIAPLFGLFLLCLEFLWGGEEGLSIPGLGIIQPAEFIKTLSALLFAYAGQRLWAIRDGLVATTTPLSFTLGVMIWTLLFIGVATWLLYAVQDLSPVLILVLLITSMSWRLAPHPRGLKAGWGTNVVRGGVIVVVLSILGIGAWVQLAPPAVPHWVPQYERLMAWAQPEQFAESGYQVNLARTFAIAGGLTGVEHGPFGWNGSVMHLPEIHNDFIGAFVLNRGGSAGGMALLCLQLLYVGVLFALSRAVAAWGAIRDFAHQRAGVFLSLSLFALAWLFIAHALIAWGNVLGLLPVMGQPMTFIAAGNSHLLFFALPGLLLGLGIGWLITEQPAER